MPQRKQISLVIFLLLIVPVCFIHCADDVQEMGDEGWSFIVMGDVRQGYGLYGQLVGNISKIDPVPVLAICCGDIMLRPANEVEWLNFWHISKPLTDRTPLYFVRGNHEGNDPASEEFLRKQLNLPNDNFYYSFNNHNTFFIILDTERRGEEQSIGNGQMDWLIHQLDSVKEVNTVQNIFIFMHHPLYPQGEFKGSNLKNADDLHSLFLQHPKIRAVIAGHDHVFNRYEYDGMTYLTTGGVEASLYHGSGGDYYHFVKISFYSSENRINVKTIGIFNEVIEDFNL
ncbi:MAG: metallophosphoesterase [Bacteroidetes bacterium]|nr:metallophosphoesterase [Bacteroidota bacterium]